MEYRVHTERVLGGKENERNDRMQLDEGMPGDKNDRR